MQEQCNQCKNPNLKGVHTCGKDPWAWTQRKQQARILPDEHGWYPISAIKQLDLDTAHQVVIWTEQWDAEPNTFYGQEIANCYVKGGVLSWSAHGHRVTHFRFPAPPPVDWSSSR